VALPGLNNSKEADFRKIAKRVRSQSDALNIVFPPVPGKKGTRRKLGRFCSMRMFIGLTLAAGALLLAGCNTISGVGRDVSSVGSTVSKTADKHK
jgi:predicted small secreted protein